MFETRIYIQICEDMVVAKNLDSGKTVQETPMSPYCHPRMLIGDFDAAQTTFMNAVGKVKSANPLNSISILLHPIQRSGDEPTPSEKIIYRMLGYDARAKKVILWFGNPVSDFEAIELLKGKPN